MNIRFSLVCVATLLATLARSEEAAKEEASADSAAAADAKAEAPKDAKAKAPSKFFSTLPLCRQVLGDGEVLIAGAKDWQPIEESRFYPLGTKFRAGKGHSTVTISFGPESSVTIEDGASFSTLAQDIGEPSRTVILEEGEVSVTLPNEIKNNLFAVWSPNFVVSNMAGNAKFDFKRLGDGTEAAVRCVTGTLALSGRNYFIPSMRAADEVRIRTSHDELETILYGKSGDFLVQLDQGSYFNPEPQEDGSIKDVIRTRSLDWHLSVNTRVQINRGVPGVGKRMSVTMMTFDSVGQLKNHFAFAEGRPEVNTGELVINLPTENAELDKKAAEVTEEAATEEKPAAEEAKTEEKKDDGEEKKKEDSSSGDGF